MLLQLWWKKGKLVLHPNWGFGAFYLSNGLYVGRQSFLCSQMTQFQAAIPALLKERGDWTTFALPSLGRKHTWAQGLTFDVRYHTQVQIFFILWGRFKAKQQRRFVHWSWPPHIDCELGTRLLCYHQLLFFNDLPQKEVGSFDRQSGPSLFSTVLCALRIKIDRSWHARETDIFQFRLGASFPIGSLLCVFDSLSALHINKLGSRWASQLFRPPVSWTLRRNPMGALHTGSAAMQKIHFPTMILNEQNSLMRHCGCNLVLSSTSDHAGTIHRENWPFQWLFRTCGANKMPEGSAISENDINVSGSTPVDFSMGKRHIRDCTSSLLMTNRFHHLPLSLPPSGLLTYIPAVKIWSVLPKLKILTVQSAANSHLSPLDCVSFEQFQQGNTLGKFGSWISKMNAWWGIRCTFSSAHKNGSLQSLVLQWQCFVRPNARPLVLFGLHDTKRMLSDDTGTVLHWPIYIGSVSLFSYWISIDFRLHQD